jgi:hypothetical protein
VRPEQRRLPDEHGAPARLGPCNALRKVVQPRVPQLGRDAALVDVGAASAAGVTIGTQNARNFPRPRPFASEATFRPVVPSAFCNRLGESARTQGVVGELAVDLKTERHARASDG